MTQINLIARHLEMVGCINPFQAWETYGCYRLSSVIQRLRHRGYLIKTIKRKVDGVTFGEYFLLETPYGKRQIS